jgi:catechol 2,3-dioxygenase-like lactoylglutathione lyase family enzyme
MSKPLTSGVHHIGLAVPDIGTAAGFFTDALGWTVVREVPDYPARFVSDGHTLLTLWQLSDPANAVPFDRKNNVGLHHLAFEVADEEALAAIHEAVQAHPGVEIDFGPEPIQAVPIVKHFICIIPGGVRIEFATPLVG